MPVRRQQRGAYESFLLHNVSQVTALESSLRSMTYVLPGRFKDAELAGEVIYALVHLLGLYHDSVLFRIVYARHRDADHEALASALASANLPKISPHARYTSFWRTTQPRYAAAAAALVTTEALQLLAEMLARRRLGERRAWDVVLAIEALKAVLRFTLVRTSQNRPVISPPLPQREFDPAQLEQQATSAIPLTWRGARTRCLRRTLASLGPRDIYEHLLSCTLTEQDVSPPPLLVRPLTKHAARIAEAVWILRPLLYVALLRTYGRRDLRPFATSLLVECLARTLRQHALVQRGKPLSPPTSSISLWLSVLGIENSFLDWLASGLSTQSAAQRPVSTVEGDEWIARNRSLWWYLLRGPVWYGWTRPKLASLVARTEHRRILGLLGSVIREYLPLIDDYYYYSAM